MLIEQQKDFKYLIVLLTGCTPLRERLFFCGTGTVLHLFNLQSKVERV